jgi:hypothetical protein
VRWGWRDQWLYLLPQFVAHFPRMGSRHCLFFSSWCFSFSLPGRFSDKF